MLVGRNVIVRTVRDRDIDGLYDLTADVRAIGDHWPLTVGSESSWVKQYRENGWWTDDFGRMLVTDRAGACLGYVNYYRASHSYPGLEIGYRVFRPEDRGHGIMTEAVALFVGYLFSAKQIERIQALTHPDNVGSRRVLERCGFAFEGTLRRAHFNRGEYTDLAMYSVLRGETKPLATLLAPADS
jgi:ribosomal-protein-alanine N-acetyltransferase